MAMLWAFGTMDGDARMVSSDVDVMVDEHLKDKSNTALRRCIVDTRTYDRSSRTGTSYLRWRTSPVLVLCKHMMLAPA